VIISGVIKIRPGITTVCEGTREALERGATYAYGFEEQEPKDHTHYRRSGLNQVLCKIATKKNVRITFSFASILGATREKRALILGRIMQNIRLCQKYKTPMKIASFATEPYQMRSPHDLAAFFSQLGMQPDVVKKALK